MNAGLKVSLGLVVAFSLACVTAAICSDTTRETSAISARSGAADLIHFRSTDRLPDAGGEARVERRGGMTAIEIDLDSLKPASLFGGDYSTYVLWVVPPQGPVENLGELPLEGDRSRMHASTEATSFALLVTAEPHYLVTKPSAFVILENERERQGQTIRYQLLEGVYNFERSSLADVKEAKGRVHTDLKQAFTAVRLAQRAGAAQLAPEELGQAQHALNQTLDLWRGRGNRVDIAAQARETIHLATAAQRLAEDRALHGARIEPEGLGGGKDEPGRRNPRDKR